VTAASKGGVVMLTRTLAVEWAPHNVRVNAIAPSWFESKIGDLIHREPGYEERSMRPVPFARMGKPGELVGAALYLASEASAWSRATSSPWTGARSRPDGGRRAGISRLTE
jgi:NAD(P)-dependent dehydrogenase (short-subunit alcohol dehydrogenase family)